MNTHLLSSQWQQLPERTLRKLQVEKLRHYLRNTVIPFSAHYREMFQKRGIKADSIRVLEDLEGLPFTSKTDLVNTPENSQKARDFVLIAPTSIFWLSIRSGKPNSRELPSENCAVTVANRLFCAQK